MKKVGQVFDRVVAVRIVIMVGLIIFLSGCADSENVEKETQKARDQSIVLLGAIRAHNNRQEYEEAKKLIHDYYSMNGVYRGLTHKENDEMFGEKIFLDSKDLVSTVRCDRACGESADYYLKNIDELRNQGEYYVLARFNENLIRLLKQKGARGYLAEAKRNADMMNFDGMLAYLQKAQAFQERVGIIEGVNVKTETAKIAVLFEQRFQRLKKEGKL